jgi:hypothetical protein
VVDHIASEFERFHLEVLGARNLFNGRRFGTGRLSPVIFGIVNS